MISLHLSLKSVQELTSVVKRKQKTAKFQFQTNKHFFSFSEVVSQDQNWGWKESQDRAVRWERLYKMWWLVIHVTVSRVWTLVLFTKTLVHAIPLLIPPGRLVSPTWGMRSNQKTLFPLCDAVSLKTGCWNRACQDFTHRNYYTLGHLSPS